MPLAHGELGDALPHRDEAPDEAVGERLGGPGRRDEDAPAAEEARQGHVVPGEALPASHLAVGEAFFKRQNIADFANIYSVWLVKVRNHLLITFDPVSTCHFSHSHVFR